MRVRKLRLMLTMSFALALILIMGCSGTKISDLGVYENVELSGTWTAGHSQRVSAALESQITASAWVEDFRAENGKKPYLIIGNVRNKSPEHIPVKTFVGDLERSFINGGRVKVVASSEERDQVRGERADQQEFSSQDTMKQWGREKGADFMFIGEINMIVDQEKGDQVKYYQVDCYLVDLEDNTKVWAGFEKIKKLVEH